MAASSGSGTNGMRTGLANEASFCAKMRLGADGEDPSGCPASSRSTWRPAAVSSSAANPPEAPAPTTTASKVPEDPAQSDSEKSLSAECVLMEFIFGFGGYCLARLSSPREEMPSGSPEKTERIGQLPKHES